MPHRPGAPVARHVPAPILRKWRSLPEARAARCVKLLFEALVLALQPIAFALGVAAVLFRTRQLVAQARDLMPLTLDQFVAILARGLRALVRHAGVMPYPRNLYKYDFLDLPWSRAQTR
jgi:hypothetical protein